MKQTKPSTKEWWDKNSNAKISFTWFFLDQQQQQTNTHTHCFFVLFTLSSTKVRRILHKHTHTTIRLVGLRTWNRECKKNNTHTLTLKYMHKNLMDK